MPGTESAEKIQGSNNKKQGSTNYAPAGSNGSAVGSSQQIRTALTPSSSPGLRADAKVMSVPTGTKQHSIQSTNFATYTQRMIEQSLLTHGIKKAFDEKALACNEKVEMCFYAFQQFSDNMFLNELKNYFLHYFNSKKPPPKDRHVCFLLTSSDVSAPMAVIVSFYDYSDAKISLELELDNKALKRSGFAKKLKNLYEKIEVTIVTGDKQNLPTGLNEAIGEAYVSETNPIKVEFKILLNENLILGFAEYCVEVLKKQPIENVFLNKRYERFLKQFLMAIAAEKPTVYKVILEKYQALFDLGTPVECIYPTQSMLDTPQLLEDYLDDQIIKQQSQLAELAKRFPSNISQQSWCSYFLSAAVKTGFILATAYTGYKMLQTDSSSADEFLTAAPSLGLTN